MSEYFDSIILANSKRKYKDVQQMLAMLDTTGKANLVSYVREHASFQLNENMQDVCMKCQALIDLSD